jgi:hypothetical protein
MSDEKDFYKKLRAFEEGILDYFILGYSIENNPIEKKPKGSHINNYYHEGVSFAEKLETHLGISRRSK